MTKKRILPESSLIDAPIFFLRHRRIRRESDLTQLCGGATNVLAPAVKRNSQRFPVDCAFVITKAQLGTIKEWMSPLSEGNTGAMGFHRRSRESSSL